MRVGRLHDLGPSKHWRVGSSFRGHSYGRQRPRMRTCALHKVSFAQIIVRLTLLFDLD